VYLHPASPGSWCLIAYGNAGLLVEARPPPRRTAAAAQVTRRRLRQRAPPRSLSEDGAVEGAAVEILGEAAQLGLRLAGAGTRSLESKHRSELGSWEGS